ncbi:MAG: cytochrome c biogenesis protein CcsA [Dehalococcoidia bacterium]|nr:cytochrome c biogenesis protein CcsA [Dehalococcoidia bacterium]
MSFFGSAILVLACVVAVYSIASALLDSRDNKYSFPKTARIGVFVVAGLMTLAEILMLISFIGHDFSLAQVYVNSSLDTPPAYLLAGLWAGNAGALLFWAWIVALSGAVVLWRSNNANKTLMPYAVSLTLFVEIFFLVLLFIDPPFKALTFPATDGLGLSLALQTPLMLFHPPVLLAGYALTVVPFALAVAALCNRCVDKTWVLTARRWLVAAWLLLGFGNILGMWWAYEVLGWGGYWVWDPVENAGLMPWLLLTALLHSNIVYLRRGMQKIWTVLLAIASFWMVILGAFITRAMPADLSNHTFAQSNMTPVFTIFLLIVLAGSAYLVIDRRHCLNSEPCDDAVLSDSNAFALFNWIILASTVVILIGTLTPLITGASTSTDYFNQINLPLFMAVILLSGLSLFLGHERPDLNKLCRQLLLPSAGGVLAVVPAVIFGWTHWYTLIPLFVLGVTLSAILCKWGRDVLSRMRGCHENVCAAFWRLFNVNRNRYGGYIVHIAVVIMALGIIGSSAYSSEARLLVVAVGESVELDGYRFTYQGLDYRPSNQSPWEMWITAIAKLDVEHNGVAMRSMSPAGTWSFVYEDGEIVESRIDSKVAIHSNLLRDVYVIFHDFSGDTEEILITLMINPLVQWIWIGGLILLLGGAVSFSVPSRRMPDDNAQDDVSAGDV